MVNLGFDRHALVAGVAAFTLAGCGAQPQQLPIGSPNATAPQNAAQAKSWMLPEAKGDDLLYITTNSKTFIDSYPQGRRVGQLSVGGFYLCADNAGNVFLSQYTEGTYGILEYPHGGTTPIATIQTPGPPWGCSIDPVTGDLAVAIPDVGGIYHGELAIYKHARGTPRILSDPSIEYMFFCRYDPSGNLFIDGTPADGTYFAELPRGAKTITDLSLNGKFYADSDIEWDGTYLAVADGFAQAVYRISVSGTTATIVSTVPLLHWTGQTGASEVWIHRNRLITSPGPHDAAAVWHYPQGGEPFLRLHPDLDHQRVEGVVVSFAPHK